MRQTGLARGAPDSSPPIPWSSSLGNWVTRRGFAGACSPNLSGNRAAWLGTCGLFKASHTPATVGMGRMYPSDTSDSSFHRVCSPSYATAAQFQRVLKLSPGSTRKCLQSASETRRQQWLELDSHHGRVSLCGPVCLKAGAPGTHRSVRAQHQDPSLTLAGPPAHQAVLWAPAPRRRLREAPGCSERYAVCSCRAWWGPDLPELSLRRADAHGLTRMGPSSVPPRHLRAPTIRGIFLRGLRATPSRGSLRKASWASGPGGGRALTQQLPASDAAPLQSRDRPWRCLLPPPVPSKAPSPG